MALLYWQFIDFLFKYRPVFSFVSPFKVKKPKKASTEKVNICIKPAAFIRTNTPRAGGRREDSHFNLETLIYHG